MDFIHLRFQESTQEEIWEKTEAYLGEDRSLPGRRPKPTWEKTEAYLGEDRSLPGRRMKVTAIFVLAMFLSNIANPDEETLRRRIEAGEVEPLERFKTREKFDGDGETGEFVPLLVVGEDEMVDLDGDVYKIKKDPQPPQAKDPQPPQAKDPQPPQAKDPQPPAAPPTAPEKVLPPPPRRPIPAPIPVPPEAPLQVQLPEQEEDDDVQTVALPSPSEQSGWTTEDIVFKVLSYVEIITGVSFSALLFAVFRRTWQHYKAGARGWGIFLLLLLDVANRFPIFMGTRLGRIFRAYVTGNNLGVEI